MYFVRGFLCFISFALNVFLTTEGEEFFCPSSISSAVKGKIVHFVNKVSNLAQTFFWHK